jgi:DNA-directed RNA polymerase III subunit RPC8
MFVLAELEDTVKIVPNDFKKDNLNAVTDVLNEKYANKVVQEVGHCICVHDILNVTEGFILYLDGCSYVRGISCAIHIITCTQRFFFSDI